MLVSIIIPTKNEEKNIGKCLESIARQSYPRQNIEIIVVDNDSQDLTKDIAAEYTDKIYNFGPERSAQRNFGVEKSSGDWIMYIDADMILDQNVIRDLVKAVQNNPDISAFYMPEIIVGEGFFYRVRDFERSFYDATVVDAVRFIKKEVFVRCGGFDVTLTGPEDWDLDKKIRQDGKTALVKTAIYHNEGEFSLKRYLGKKRYYIGNFDAYIAKWGRSDPDIKKQFSFGYRYFGVFLEHGKWKKMFCHPILALGMYFLRFLVGLNFLLSKTR